MCRTGAQEFMFQYFVHQHSYKSLMSGIQVALEDVNALLFETTQWDNIFGKCFIRVTVHTLTQTCVLIPDGFDPAGSVAG